MKITRRKLGLIAALAASATVTALAVLLVVNLLDNNSMIMPGNDPNFTIVANTDGRFGTYNRKVDVMGIPIYAAPRVGDAKLLHAANVMAQYLDNNEDGTADNPQVLQAMQDAGAFMVMWHRESDLILAAPSLILGGTGQDLGGDETRPEWHSIRATRFDAALEEVWHIISHAGYANAYPDAFAERAGSQIANAMDTARGGQFQNVPQQYPADAWYTYDDQSCNYNCQVTEYFYWGITSILGAQTEREEEISDEWQLNTRAKVREQDPALYALLTDPQYGLPTELPDGTYMQ